MDIVSQRPPTESLTPSLPVRGNAALSAKQANEEKAVAAQFEGILLEQLLRGMRQGTFATKQEFGRQTFEQMFDAEIAKAVAEQGLGLGDALFAPSASVRPQEPTPFRR